MKYTASLKKRQPVQEVGHCTAEKDQLAAYNGKPRDVEHGPGPLDHKANPE